ncbi:MAG: hypothetical protein RJS97_00855 [Parvibaculaceae bacterium]
MTTDSAETMLVHDTQTEEGTYFLLRLGKDPGDGACMRLRNALRTIQARYSASSSVPRDVAFSCGVILHFAQECRRNLEDSGLTNLVGNVDDIQQGAFDVLAGTVADEWAVPRTGLDDAT